MDTKKEGRIYEAEIQSDETEDETVLHSNLKVTCWNWKLESKIMEIGFLSFEPRIGLRYSFMSVIFIHVQ